MQELEYKKYASAGAVWRLYLRYTKPYAGLFFGLLAADILIQAAALVAPLYLKQLLNVVATHGPDAAAVHTLMITLAVVGLAWFADRTFRRLQDLCNITLQSKVMASLFDGAFGYLMGHSYNFFISNFAGSLTHRVTKFARAYETMFDTIMITLLPTFLFVIGAVVILFVNSHVLGVLLGLWCVAFVWFQFYAARWRQPARRARAEAETQITASLADSIGNQSAVMLFSGITHERSRFHRVVETWRKAIYHNWLIDSAFWGAVGFFVVAIQVGIYYGAIKLWAQGLLTVGDFVLIQAYLMSVFEQLVGINRDMRRFFDAYSDASEMVAIMEEPHGVEDTPHAKSLQLSKGEVNFEHVGFHFLNAHDPILADFNLLIPGGQKLALVGPSGAGKSTITRLLLRLYDVKSGRITIDGHTVAEVTQESLRDAISYVPQEPVLFHRSLMENIRYGRRDATDAEVIEAAKKAHCDEFISALPDRYQTYVGERGVKLSGGERQRVAIARAILKNAPILVLDEATSSLDSESEALIQDALKTLMEGKTVIVIAHRLSTIMKMDRIVVLEKGKIEADGTHNDLIEGRGLYHKLWSIQAGGFVDDTIDEESETEGESDTKERPLEPQAK